MKPLKLTGILLAFCFVLFLTIKLAIWNGPRDSKSIETEGVEITEVLPDDVLVRNHETTKPDKLPDSIQYDKRTESTGPSGDKKTAVSPSKEVKPQKNEVIPASGDFKEKLVKAYNDNSWKKCQEIIKKNSSLKVYAGDLEWIFRIRQNIKFDSRGFTKPELSPRQIEMLYASGYIDASNRPTGKFKITDLQHLKRIRTELEEIIK